MENQITWEECFGWADRENHISATPDTMYGLGSLDCRAPPRLSPLPGAGVVEFHFTALSFLVPEKVRFKYKLEGFDEHWSAAGTQRLAHYTNLPPGTYRFRVIACNNDGVWNETGATFEFYLQPHFYQTKWFYALCALAVILAGFGLYRLRVGQLRRRTEELEVIVDQRTDELKQEQQKQNGAEESNPHVLSDNEF